MAMSEPERELDTHSRQVRRSRNRIPWGLVTVVVVFAIVAAIVVEVAWTALTPDPEPDAIGRTVVADFGDCLNLDRWTGRGWERIGYASLSDASDGRWGPPQDVEYCQLGLALDAVVMLPPDAAPGFYRVCDLGEAACVVLHVDP